MKSSALRFGFTHLLPALPIALVMTVAAPAQAVISNFTLTGASPLNTPAPSYTETVNGITLTVSNAMGTDLPTLGGISGNPQGLCTWLQNSASTQRCGFNTGTGATTSSQLSSLSFSFDKAVYLKDFFIQLNDVTSTDINFSGGISTTLAGISASSTQSLADVILPANTPIIFAAQNVIPGAGFDSTALRMRNFNVEEVPGPLPFLGVGAAFSMTRKLRRYSARSQA
jgi:hypothetical protein